MMEFNEYQELASRTRNPELNKRELLANTSMGLAGEVGELLDHLKKHLYHGHPFDPDYVSKELGDIMWYTAELASQSNLHFADIVAENIDKLRRRYPAGFTTENSIHRSV